MNQAFRDHEIALMNPPVIEIPSEKCDGIGGRHELDDDHVVALLYSTWNDVQKRYDERTEYVCSECFREKLKAHARTAKPYEIADFPWDDQSMAERCDQCHAWRCSCP